MAYTLIFQGPTTNMVNANLSLFSDYTSLFEKPSKAEPYFYAPPLNIAWVIIYEHNTNTHLHYTFV